MTPRKYLFIWLIVLTPQLLLGQSKFSVSGAMGLSFVNTPDVKNYLIYVTGLPDQVNSFSSNLQLSLEGNYRVHPDLDISLLTDLVFSSNEFDVAGFGSRYKLNYLIIKPSLCAYKVYPGAGYQFRVGGGIGPRFLSVSETNPGFTSEVSFTKVGFGAVATFDAATALTDVAMVYLNGNLQYDVIGAPEHEGAALQRQDNKKNVTFNNFSAGVKIGILYQF